MYADEPQVFTYMYVSFAIPRRLFCDFHFHYVTAALLPNTINPPHTLNHICKYIRCVCGEGRMRVFDGKIFYVTPDAIYVLHYAQAIQLLPSIRALYLH